MDIKVKVIDWFKSVSGKKDFSLELNYFDQDLIDSFDVILLMEFCESEFEIHFSETQFEDRRFSTINGLCEIIGELKE
ncbi:hypothetical protein AL542_05015 [Grimontia hollisae]|uniref:hypothetical protein n=1 Tax=Grimontia hollisae TaxID=673 RepID=UPI00058D3D6E|nr:hypothetical protein [Grimontia hollisae]AMG29816.1 hypothetical protein AL542_05015 [Grimontia hollisae]STO43278.1 D-alanine--poly(phosphoribitol) ligase subunit 2 [Grimontia hollisae]